MTPAESEESIQENLKIRYDPVYYIEEYLGVRTWVGMRRVINSVWDNQRTSVRACHGISKTFCSACIAVAFLNLFDNSVVITTAPTNRQVEKLLWKEIGGLYIRNKHLKGECQTMAVKINPEWYAVGFSTDSQTSLEGFHAPYILWVLDEAKGLPQWVYDAAEGSMSGGFGRILEISTTDGADQSTPFRRHHSREIDEWNTMHLSAYDSPFVTGEWDIKEATKIQIATTEWIEGRKKAWEKKRPELWETKVLGGFSSEGTNNLIPLKWVESAVNAEVEETNQPKIYGLDVARMGNDTSVLTPKQGKKVEQQITWGKVNTMETTGKAMEIAKEYELIKVDSCGIGAGVFDRLAELGQPVIGLDSASAAFDAKKFFNLRAEMWWCARELFEKQYEDGNTISIPDDPELVQDLTGLKYKIKSDGRIIAEAKEEYKKRLTRSPDKGDSFVYCVYEPEEMAGEYVGETTDDEIVYM